jgi:hypothetical protein
MVVLATVSVAGCESSALVKPEQPDVTPAFSQAGGHSVGHGKPEIDPTYANGKTVYMIGPHLIVNARATMPNAYAHADELYLVTYPQTSLPLGSGYQPQCNPCFHPGLPPQFVYHDHVITGAPGMGNHGTAGNFKAPWKIVILIYDPAYLASPSFKPITSAADIDAAEAAGGVFVPFNTGAPNPYEFEPGNLLICPIVSSHA